MHIEKHAKKTVEKMMDLFIAIQTIKIASDTDTLAKLTKEDIAALDVAYIELSSHLFD